MGQVILRNWAVMLANLKLNQTVGITDLDSMHGTFLNKTKVAGPGSRPTRIQVGDEVTLGLPVFRNHEEFHPALIRVEGLEFCET